MLRHGLRRRRCRRGDTIAAGHEGRQAVELPRQRGQVLARGSLVAQPVRGFVGERPRRQLLEGTPVLRRARQQLLRAPEPGADRGVVLRRGRPEVAGFLGERAHELDVPEPRQARGQRALAQRDRQRAEHDQHAGRERQRQPRTPAHPAPDAEPERQAARADRLAGERALELFRQLEPPGGPPAGIGVEGRQADALQIAGQGGVESPGRLQVAGRDPPAHQALRSAQEGRAQRDELVQRRSQ